MGSKIWKNKPIDNPPETPWLDWIVDGTKKFEGRINRKDLAKMKVGDTIILVNNEKKVAVKIVSLNYYPTFADAFGVHDKQLLPNVDTKSEAIELYHKIFWKEEDQEDLKKYGTVIIGVEPKKEVLYYCDNGFG